MRYDLHVNPNGRSRRDFPLVVVLQSDAVGGQDRLVAPLARPVPPLAGPANRALVNVRHGGAEYIILLTMMGSILASRLAKPVGSLREYRDDINRVLDWIFFGW
jgi:hypothetical protein